MERSFKTLYFLKKLFPFVTLTCLLFFAICLQDADRRIREATFLAHKQICVMTGRNLAPFLKGVLATWLAGMYDVYAPAASAARCGFETVFPVHKHADVFLFYLKDTLFVSFLDKANPEFILAFHYQCE